MATGGEEGQQAGGGPQRCPACGRPLPPPSEGPKPVLLGGGVVDSFTKVVVPMASQGRDAAGEVILLGLQEVHSGDRIVVSLATAEARSLIGKIEAELEKLGKHRWQ